MNKMHQDEVSKTPTTATSSSSLTSSSDDNLMKPDLGLFVSVHRRFLSRQEEEALFNAVIHNMRWYRVKYESERHGNQCETPCWTNMFGGFSDMAPYQAIPPCLSAIVEKVSERTSAKYNAVLVRLYFDGKASVHYRYCTVPVPVTIVHALYCILYYM